MVLLLDKAPTSAIIATKIVEMYIDTPAGILS